MEIPKQKKKIVGEKKENAEVIIVLEIDSHRVVAGIDDEIEISKKTKFKIKSVKTSPPLKKVKANFVGFVGNSRYNDGQDIGYLISYNKIKKRLAVDKNKKKYKINITCRKEKLGTVYIKYVD